MAIKRVLLAVTFLLVGLAGVQSAEPDKWDYLVTIRTNYGEMQVVLFDETPKHKANFLKLIEQGFYDSLLFHRVIKEFMIQGGDPNSRNAEPGTSLGTGGPGYTIPAEIRSSLFHKKGVLAAARTGDRVNPHRASSGSQFYIVQGDTIKEEDLVPLNRQIMQDAFKKIKPGTALYDSLRAAYAKGANGFEEQVAALSDSIYAATGFRVKTPAERVEVYTEIGGAPHLDDQYTIFGEVIRGMEVIDRIAEVEVGRSDRPREDVWMVITAQRMKKKKITKLYGYQYDR